MRQHGKIKTKCGTERENLKISARAEDGTIEAIENCDLSILGVQWHPELLLKGGKDEMLKLFEAFVEKAKEKKKI